MLKKLNIMVPIYYYHCLVCQYSFCKAGSGYYKPHHPGESVIRVMYFRSA